MKKMKLLKWLLAIVFFVSSMLGTMAHSEDYPIMSLRYASFISAKSPTAKPHIFLANEITRRTGGRVQVNIFLGGTLGKSAEIIDLLGEGAVDIGNFAHGYSFARLPMNAFFNTPLIYTNHKIASEMEKRGCRTQEKVIEDMK